MPKKKKAKSGGGDSEREGWISVKRRVHRPAATARGDGDSDAREDAGPEEERQTQELRYLQEMFAGKLDPVVVHMIMNDCDFKVEAALETLFELCDQTSPVESQMYRLSGFKDVYIPKTETEEQEEDEDDDENVQDTETIPATLFHGNYGNRGGHDLLQENRDDDVQLLSRGLGLPPVTKSIHKEEVTHENSFSASRANALSDFPTKRRGLTSSPSFTTSSHQKKNPFDRHSHGGVNSPFNNLSQVKASSTVVSSRDDRGGSSVADTEDSPESKVAKTPTHKMNICTDDVSGLDRKDDQLAGRGAPTSEVGFRQNPFLSDDLETDSGGSTMHLKMTPMSVEQLFGRGSVPSLEEKLKQESPRTEVVSGSSPIGDLPSDDLEALLGEIEMCPDKSSASEQNIQDSNTENHPGLAVEFSQDTNSEKVTSTPVEMKSKTEFDQNGQVAADKNLRNGNPENHSAQIEMEDVSDVSQKSNLDSSAPVFIPRAYARPPAPRGHQQYPPFKGFQLGYAQRMPRVPHSAGRASSLKSHLMNFDGQVRKPFFTPFPSSEGQRHEGAETRGPQMTPHPGQRFQPPKSAFRPVSQSQSQVPFWQQNQVPHLRHRYPVAPIQNYQSSGRRMMSLVQGAPHEGIPPPGGLQTNLPHEGARQLQDSAQWPITKHTTCAPRVQVDNTQQARLHKDKVVPLPGGKVLCLMRGCPGSGKSTLARKLVGRGRILSTDDYFIADDGQYHFDVTKLSDAHDWSHQRAKEVMESGITPLIIDNTNVERWTMKPYVAMALKYGYAVEFREPTTPWKFNVGKLFSYNTHGVPKDRIKLMVERYERDVTVENILGSSKPTKMKRKIAETGKQPPSRGSWRRPKKEAEANLGVDDISKEDEGAGSSKTSWRNQGRHDATTDEKEVVEHCKIQASSATVEEALVTGVAVVTDAKKEESQNGDEMFMSDDENGFDALMDSLACDSVEEATGSFDKQERNETLQGGIEDGDKMEDAYTVVTVEKKASSETMETLRPSSSEEKLTDSKKSDRTEDAKKMAENNLTASGNLEVPCDSLEEPTERTRHKGLVDVTGGKGEDDFVAMGNAMTETCNSPLAEIYSPENSDTPQKEQMNSYGDVGFAEVMNSFSEALHQPVLELLPEGQEPKHSETEKVDHTNDKENASDEDDFAAVMNLIADAACKQSDTQEEVECGKIEDDAARITSVEDTEDVEQRKRQTDQSQQRENEDRADDKNGDVGFLATMKPIQTTLDIHGAELTGVEKQLFESVQKDDEAQQQLMAANRKASEEMIPVSGEDVPSSTSLDTKEDPTAEADGCDCKSLDELAENAVGWEEKNCGKTERADSESVGADGSDSKASTQGGLISVTTKNDGYSVSMSEPQSKSDVASGQSALSTGDINSNHVDSVNLGARNGDGEPSVDQGKPSSADPLIVGSSNAEVHTDGVLSSSQSTSPLALSASTPSCRSLSPSIPAPSSTPGESIAKQHKERRKLRRSRSLNKSPKMAAVFPTLSPGSENWSELAEMVGRAGEEEVEKPGLSSPSIQSISFAEAGTMTLPLDFSYLQKLESGKLTVEDLQQQGFHVAFGQAQQISTLHQREVSVEKETVTSEAPTSYMSNSHSPIPVSVRLHKSTMTDHERQMEDSKDSLLNLISLFPSYSQNDLEDILTQCMGDPEWAINILLDDSGNKKTINPIDPVFRALSGTDQLSSRNQKVDAPSVLVKIEPGGEESQFNDETSAKKVEMEERLEAKRVSQAGNLATSMISVVDDILKTISSENTKTPVDKSLLNKKQLSESETKNGSVLNQFPSLQIDNLVQETKANSNQLNMESSNNWQDSNTVVGSDISNLNREPVQSHMRYLQNDGKIALVDLVNGQEQTSEGFGFSGEKPISSREDPVTITQNLPEATTQIIDSQTLSEGATGESDILESPTLEASFETHNPHSTENQHPDRSVDPTNLTSAFPGMACFQWKDSPDSQSVQDFRSSGRETKDEQVVRPKTSFGIAPRQSSTKASKTKKSKVPDIYEKMSRVLEAEAPLRRDQLVVAGGVQFSWNKQGEVEEFRVPRPEQTMTKHEDASEVGDESVMTEEQADAILQDQPGRKKLRELRSLNEGLILQLPPAFALQLQEMFGSIGFHLHPDGLPAEDLQVHVDYDLAKQLHSLWGQTLQTRFNQEEELDSIIQADEELARRLQQEEDIHHMTKVQSARSAKYQGSKASPMEANWPISWQHGYGDTKGTMGALASPGKRQAAGEETKGLKEIMEEELAAQLSKDVEVEEKLSSEESASIATKLKRDKLYSEFPKLDRGALEDIFRANNYQLDPSIKYVKSFFISASGQPKAVYSNEALDRIERELIERTERESLASSEGTDDSNPQESFYQSMDNPDYQDYRAEATQHYRLRHEAFQKAAAAYNRGQKELASFYSQQGHLHTEKLKEANKRASESILTSKNSLFSDNTLDLHGLHVDEALQMLNQVLSDKRAELEAYDQQPRPVVSKSPQRHIFIITGKGNHSRGGVARIRPAVIEHLKQGGYRFSMPNAGLLKVNL